MSRKRSSKLSKASGVDDENVKTNNQEPLPKKLKSEKSRINPTNKNILRDYNMNCIVKYYENLQNGNCVKSYRYSVKRSLIEQIKTFRIVKSEGFFHRRVTFLEWHPTNPRLLAMGSKGGDIILWNYDEPTTKALFVNGIGPGGSILAMKFDSQEFHKIYLVSMEGKFVFLNLQNKMSVNYLDTADPSKWYLSLDIDWGSKTMVVGDTEGTLTCLTTNGEVVNKFQIHKRKHKVNHVEFSKRDPTLLCSSSMDRTVKFWDIRQIKQNNSGLSIPLHEIHHIRAINAAHFSLTDGSRILMTDQFDKILVFRSPLWDLETEISHPHRQYQYLTPIKAYWHPLEDIFFIGRYPAKEFPGNTNGEPRTIDFFDAHTGELLYQHFEAGFNGIASINRFNILGDVWASGTGATLLLRKPVYGTGTKSIPILKNKTLECKSKNSKCVG